MGLYMMVFGMKDGDRSNAMTLSVKRNSNGYAKLREGCFLMYRKDGMSASELYGLFSMPDLDQEKEMFMIVDLSETEFSGFTSLDVMKWIKKIVENPDN